MRKPVVNLVVHPGPSFPTTTGLGRAFDDALPPLGEEMHRRLIVQAIKSFAVIVAFMTCIAAAFAFGEHAERERSTTYGLLIAQYESSELAYTKMVDAYGRVSWMCAGLEVTDKKVDTASLPE